MAKAAYWTETDTEARKRGEQTGLDTLVVHAVNDDNSLSAIHLSLRPEGKTYFYVRRRMSRLGKVLRVASN